MSKRLPLTDVPGVGPAMQEKLQDAGIKTAYSLSKADPKKLAEKIDGLGITGAEKIVAAARELFPDEDVARDPAKAETKPEKPKTELKAKEDKPKKAAKVETPEPKTPEKKATSKPSVAKTAKAGKPSKKESPKAKPKEEVVKVVKKKEAEVPAVSGPSIDKRLFRLAAEQKRRKPKFRHEQAHRWTRISDSWRKVRGIDSATREKRKGRIAMVSAGYRSPKAVRGLHPSGYVEALVHRTDDLETLNPEVHAVRIASRVGMRKRQEILDRAEAQSFRILNPSVAESVAEEDLFEELEGLDDLEVDE